MQIRRLRTNLKTWLARVWFLVRLFVTACLGNGLRSLLARAAARASSLSAKAFEAEPSVTETDLWELRSQGLWGSPGARESNYWAQSTAPAEILWQLVSDLADIASWHPLITSTNAPRGLHVKPGLIYQTVSRYFPLSSTKVFVERVLPGELVSIRLFPLPGLQERVTYRIVSTLCGTCVLYTIALSGWLSPFAWPMMKSQATHVAAALVEAAEAAALHHNESQQRLYPANPGTDIFA